MKRASTVAAILVAASVTGLTLAARADDPAVAPAAAAAAPEPVSATPLVLRPTRPLATAPEPTHASTGWKIAAACIVLAGAAFWLRKRMQPAGLVAPNVPLAIVRRTPVGFRSELVVVDVEGQRFLLGVTPHSIQSLATLDGDSQPDVAAAAAGGSTVGDKFSAMLDSAGRRTSLRDRAEPPASVVAPAAAPAAHDDLDVAGQARGLLALRGRR